MEIDCQLQDIEYPVDQSDKNAQDYVMQEDCITTSAKIYGLLLNE